MTHLDYYNKTCNVIFDISMTGINSFFVSNREVGCWLDAGTSTCKFSFCGAILYNHFGTTCPGLAGCQFSVELRNRLRDESNVEQEQLQ